jgi:hypothetical protein
VGSIKTFVESYLATCRDFRQVVEAEQGALAKAGGRLGNAYRTWTEAEKEVEDAVSLSRSFKASYEAARSRYEAAKDPAQLQRELASAHAELAKLDDLVKKAGTLTRDRLRLAGLEERMEDISRGIDRVSSGQPATGSVAELALSSAVKLETIDKEAQLAPLLLEAGRLRAEAAAAQTRVDHQSRRLVLQGDLVSEVNAELQLLLEARTSFDGATCARPAETVAANLKAASSSCKDRVAETLLRVANLWTLREVRQRRLDRLIDGDIHEEAIALSASAVDAWRSILAVPIDQVAKLHASGAKPEELARLLVQVLGLGAIATAILVK